MEKFESYKKMMEVVEALVKIAKILECMITSSNGNIFRVTGPLCGKFTGHRWLPLTVTRSIGAYFDLRLE